MRPAATQESSSAPHPRSRPRQRPWLALGVRVLSVLLLAPLLGGCTPAVPAVQRLSSYGRTQDRPLAERVLPADEGVLDRAQVTNRAYGDDVRPTAARADHPLAPVVRRVLADLPPDVARLARWHLVAVYLVEGDVGTATTEGVWDPLEGWRHAYILLNLSALERTANSWATWKERSAFRKQAGYDLRMTLEPPETDDQEGAVRFILLHELGHVLGLGLAVHNYWDDVEYGPGGPGAPSPFARLSWEPEDAERKGTLRSRHAGFFPGPYFVDFYRFEEARNDLSAAPDVYEALARTDFPSLYGTLGVYDDFAESFAIYVHTQLLQKPYQVQVLQRGHVVETFRSCIATRACPHKVALLEEMLGRRKGAAPQGGG